MQEIGREGAGGMGCQIERGRHGNWWGLHGTYYLGHVLLKRMANFENTRPKIPLSKWTEVELEEGEREGEREGGLWQCRKRWQRKLYVGDLKPGSAARTLDFVASPSLLHLRFTHQQVCQRTTPCSLFPVPSPLFPRLSASTLHPSPARTIEF